MLFVLVAVFLFLLKFHLVLLIGFQVRGSRGKPMVYSTLYQKHLEWCFLLGGKWSFLKCTGLRFYGKSIKCCYYFWDNLDK